MDKTESGEGESRLPSPLSVLDELFGLINNY
jgi:hypothetical protein